ncbi:hypothetical protein KXS15_13685 [Sinorhizobium meliloti]|uniref:hypothetical protein n=1 Tax=Rhizobium meliloti TaxID=382 RepID=UPI003F17B2FE
MNVDLDYFFCADASGGWMQMVSDTFIDEKFRGVRKATDNGSVAVVTICLTPDGYAPSWNASG